jgi:hypothetical protein
VLEEKSRAPRFVSERAGDDEVPVKDQLHPGGMELMFGLAKPDSFEGTLKELTDKVSPVSVSK